MLSNQIISNPPVDQQPTADQQEFFYAALQGDMQIVKNLCEDKLKNINVNQKFTEKGGFALFVAAQGGHFDVVNYLLNLPSIDINLKTTFQDLSALHIAANKGYIDIVTAIISTPDKKVDIDIIQGSSNLTPLHLAVKSKNLEMVNLLLKAGANPNIKDKARNTALDNAILNDNNDIINLLDGSEKRLHCSLIYFIKLLGFKSNLKGICHGFAETAKILLFSGKKNKEIFYRLLIELKKMKIDHLLYLKKLYESKIKQAEEQEILYLHITTLLRVISLKQDDRDKYQYPLEKKDMSNTKEFSSFSKIIQDESLKKKYSMTLYSSANAFKNKKELSTFFSSFRNRILEIKEISDPVSFTLSFHFQNSSIGHTISVFFDPADDTWELMDVDHMFDQSDDFKKNILPGSIDISSNIHAGLFSGKNEIVFYTKIETTQQQGYLIKPAINQWQLDICSLLKITKNKIESLHSIKQLWLYIAARGGDRKSVKKLINNGVSIQSEVYNKMCDTPLYIAAGCGHHKVVNIILSQPNINPDEKITETQHTPLMIATTYGYTKIVKSLLSAKADPNAKNSEGVAAIHLAVENGHSDIVELLLKIKNISIVPTNLGETLLQLISTFNHIEIFQIFMRKKSIEIDPNEHANGTTALCRAVLLGHTKLVELMLSAKFKIKLDLNFQQALIPLPLYTAAFHGHAEIMRLLIEAGATVNTTYYGESSAYVAAKYNHTHAIKVLIEAKADLNLYNSERKTPLHIAIHQENQELNTKYLSPTASMIKLLIDAGIDMDILDLKGKKAIDYANESTKVYIQQILNAKERKTVVESCRFFKYELENNLIPVEESKEATMSYNNPIILPKIAKNKSTITIKTNPRELAEQDYAKTQTFLKSKNSDNHLIRYGLYATVAVASAFIIRGVATATLFQRRV
jgi:ankyrin repeat protein